MLSKKLLLLASALPVAVWLQGCKKDKKDKDPKDAKKPGDKKTTDPKDPVAKQEANTQQNDADYNDYFTNGNKKEVAQALLKDPTVSFEIVDAMFSAFTEDVSALVVPYLPNKPNEPISGPGFTNEQLLSEYRVEYTKSVLQQRQGLYNRQVVPAMFSQGMLDSATVGKTAPVLFTGRRWQQVTQLSCESIIVESIVPSQQVVAADKAPMKLMIISELYHVAGGQVGFPRGQANNFAVVFMPYINNSQIYFDICVKTFWHVVFLNHATALEVSQDQQNLWAAMHDNDRQPYNAANPWEFYHMPTATGNAVPAGQQAQGVVQRRNVGSRMPQSDHSNRRTYWSNIEDIIEKFNKITKKMMDFHTRTTRSAANAFFPPTEFRGQIWMARNLLSATVALDTVNLNTLTNDAALNLRIENEAQRQHTEGNYGKYFNAQTNRHSKWDFKDPVQFKLWLEFTLAYHPDAISLITELFKIKEDLDWLYEGVPEYVQQSNIQVNQQCPGGFVEIFQWNGDMFNTYGHKTTHAAYPNYNDGKSSIEDPVAAAAGIADANRAHKLCLPVFIMEPLFAGKPYFPKKGGNWEEFQIDVFRAQNQQSPYLIPAKLSIDALDSYKIEDLRVLNPGNVDPIFVEVMLIAFYHAYRGAKSQMYNMQMSDKMILGDNGLINGSGYVGQINQHQQNGMNTWDHFVPFSFKTSAIPGKLTYVTQNRFLNGDEPKAEFEAVARKLVEVKTVLREVPVEDVEVDIQEKVYFHRTQDHIETSKPKPNEPVFEYRRVQVA